MTGLSPELSRRLRDTLSRCGPFDSDRSLRAAFVDARIRPWRDLISDNTPSRATRVDALIEALIEQANDAGDPALALFLDVLADRTSSGDACKQQLDRLAAELRQLPPSSTKAGPTPSAPSSPGGKYVINIHGGQVGAIGDGTHVEGGIHFGGPPPVAPADSQAALIRARRALATLEEQAAGYTSLTIPVNLKLDLEDKRREVAEMEGKTANHQIESPSREQKSLEEPSDSLPASDSIVDKIRSVFTNPFLQQRADSVKNELELYPLNCGDRGIELGEQRLLVSSAFGMYFTGLLERDYNYVNLPAQIECPAMTRGQTLSGIQRIFWALQYPKGPRILIIAAEGGMGKSTLAAKVVRCMMEEEASDVLLGDSAKTQQVDPITGEVRFLEPGYYDIQTFYARLVNQLGLPDVDTPSSALTAIKDRLVGRRAVIVIDNLETVQKGDELLRSLRAIVSRDVRAIITTRKVEGLQNLTVKSLVVHLKPLEDFESVCTFLNWHIQRYAAEYPELERVQDNLVHSTQIMRLIECTGGIPLLLQLVVSDVARFSWEYLWNLPRLFGGELLAYLYETRWEELGDLGVAGETARLILRYIVDNQYRGEPVTLRALSEYLEYAGRLSQLQPALSLLYSRFMVINQDSQRGNFTVVPSLAAFLEHVTTQ